MNKNISIWLITPQTNLHVGNESVVNFSVIDKAIQRDVTNGLPCINSSSLKGAVKEYLDQVSDMGEDKDKIIQLFGSVKGNNDTTQKGSAVFFDANLLAIPVPDHNNQGYVLAYSEDVIRSFVEKANAMGGNVGIDKVRPANGLCKERREFNELCSDDSLPIIARNCLDNGESVNLWYEQVLPSKSVLATIILTPNANDLDVLNGKIVQIGANATIGYGYCKFEKL